MTTPKRKYVHLTEDRWHEAIALYEAGAGSVRSLSEMFGVSRHTMQAGLKKRGAVKGLTAAEHAKEVAAKVAVECLGEPETHAERIRRARDRYLELADKIQGQVAKAVSFNPKSISAAMEARAALQALDIGMKTIERTYNAQAKVLGINENYVEEENLPELVFRIVRDEDIKEMREQQDKSGQD